MRLRVVEIEGTPEEISKADIEAMLRRSHTGAELTAAKQVADQLPADVEDLINSEVPANRKATAVQFLSAIVGWGDVDARRGTSAKLEDGMTRYVRLHRRGTSLGAFAYFRPRRLKVTLRLPKEAALGQQHAEARAVKAKNPYQIKIYLRSAEALEEGLALARAAYEKVVA